MVLFFTVALSGTQAAAAGKETGMTPKAAETKGAMSSGKVYTLSGKVVAVNVAGHTAVIDCPEGKKMFTVAGPLDPKAILKKGGKACKLENFKIGEKVEVKWRSGPEGHRIFMLSAT